MKYHLAIDIGASSGRHILGWIENGKMQTQEIYRFVNSPEMIDGHLCWNTQRLFNEILSGLKVAGEMGKSPESIGIDTWGVDYALLDEDDKLIDGVYAYRDSRTEKTIELVHEKIPFEELYSKTGIAFATFNTIYQLYDDLLTGRMQRAKTFLNLPDYFHFLLTGEKRQEYTMATTTGMVDSLTRTWSEDILDRLGYNKSLFCPLYHPQTKVGKLLPKIASVVGYQTQVVLPATHDTASAVLAAPLEEQSPYISSGTWSLLGVEQNYAHTDSKAEKSGYSNEGSISGSFRLQKNIMGLWIIQQVKKEIGGQYSFSQIAELAEKNPVKEIIDVNSHNFFAPESMTKAIYKAAGREMNLGETAYCVYNSLAHDYKNSILELEKITGQKYSTLNIIGGGSQNELLNKLTAEITQKKVFAGPTESTAIGNLLMQMMGLGDVKNLQAGRKMIKQSFDIIEV